MRKCLLLTMCLVMLGMSSAYATVTLPETGVDVSMYVSTLVSSLGAVIATVVGATFAFFVIRRAISWVKGYVR